MTEKDYLKQIDYVIESGPYTDSWQSLCKHKTPEWYKNAKFGIFIHWGIYSVPAFGNEWYSREMYDKSKPAYRHHREKYGNQKDFGYKDFIPMFKAENFNPEKWAELFKNSGAKYVMPVAEHHDGFAMYNTEFNRWNSVNRTGTRCSRRTENGCGKCRTCLLCVKPSCRTLFLYEYGQNI